MSAVRPIFELDLPEAPQLATIADTSRLRRGDTHIIKSFDPQEYPELAANEYFCLRAAHHAGLPTPMVGLSDDRRILVVERFDRSADGTCLSSEDSCVLSGLPAHDSYPDYLLE
jgi:serine/threonine protein kinase HipA of HipAB toxin-antitoxin module